MTQLTISRAGFSESDDLYIAAFDPEHIFPNELPYEQTFFRLDEMDWVELGFYDVHFVDALVEDGATNEMIGISRAGEFIRNLATDNIVKLPHELLGGYSGGCRSTSGFFLAGTNGRVLEVNGVSQRLISEEFIETTPRTGGILSLERYEGVEAQLHLISCGVAPDNTLLAVGARGAAILRRGSEWSQLDTTSSEMNFVRVRWSDAHEAFLVTGASREHGYLYLVTSDGNSQILAQTATPHHLIDVTVFENEVFVLDGMSSSVLRLNGNRLDLILQTETASLGFGIAMSAINDSLCIVFDKGVMLYDGTNSRIVDAPSLA